MSGISGLSYIPFNHKSLSKKNVQVANQIFVKFQLTINDSLAFMAPRRSSKYVFQSRKSVVITQNDNQNDQAQGIKLLNFIDYSWLFDDPGVDIMEQKIFQFSRHFLYPVIGMKLRPDKRASYDKYHSKIRKHVELQIFLISLIPNCYQFIIFFSLDCKSNKISCILNLFLITTFMHKITDLTTSTC